MRTNPKKFDCLKMKSKVQAKLWSKLRGLTPEKQLAWWKEREAETRLRLEKPLPKT